MMRKAILAVVATLAAAGAAGHAASLPVTLTLREHGGVARPAWPVTSGVPLPRGAVKDVGKLTLKDAAGKAVSCQADAVVRWPDGSVKWVELNFQADLAAGAERKYALGEGAPTAPARAVKVTDGAEAVTVDTGAVSFTVPRKKGRIIGEVRVGGKLVLTGGGMTIIGAKGVQKDVAFSTLHGKVEKVVVERSGPMMARIFIVATCSSKDGKPYIDTSKSKKRYSASPLGDFFKVRVRIHAYAGKPFVNMVVSLTHGGPMDDSPDAFFKSAALKLAPGGALTNAAAEGVSGTVGGKGFVLFQYLGAGRPDYAMKFVRKAPQPHFKVLVDGAEKKKGSRAAGSVVATGEAGVLGIAVRRFYEYAPTAIAVRAGEVSVELLPDDPEQEMHMLDQGRQRSHEVLLDFSGKAGEHLAAFQAPRLLALAPPAWYADLEVFGMIAEEPKDLSAYPREQRKAIKDLYRLQRRLVDPKLARSRKSVFECFHYGWLDYGDLHWRPGWSNGHYDWTLGMLLGFLRTGDRQFFEAADAFAWHRMDIAQSHNIEFGKVNGRYAWSRGCTYYEKDNHRTVGPGPKQTHSWNRGVGYYALLTGNEMARQTALLSGKGLTGYFPGTIADGKWRGNWRSRNPSYASHRGQEQRAEGWSIENFLGNYEISGEEKWKKYAANLFKATMLDYKRTAAWKGKGMGNGVLMFGYVLSPSCRSHYYSKDPEILAGIKYIIDEGLLNKQTGILKFGEKGADGHTPTFFTYQGKKHAAHNIMYANPVAYLYMQTGEEKYLKLARQLFRSGVRWESGFSGMSPGHGTKVNGWLGRFNQIYLYMEKELARGAKFPRK